MSETHIYLPWGKEGSGHTSQCNTTPAKAFDMAIPLMLSALKKITDVKKKDLYTICEFGAGDGGNSMNVIRECIHAEVQVWYEDLPTNDFKSLFYRLHGFIENPQTYLKEFQGVHVAAIGTEFYEQCVPSNSVDLAISSTAVLWLGKRPCNLKNALWHGWSCNDEEVNVFKEQAAKYWEKFLVCRAAELAPGGQAVIATLVIDEKGYFTGSTAEAKELWTMTSIWKRMVKEGIITENEFVETTFDFYHHTEEELKYPFKDMESPVWKSGLRLMSVEVKTVPCSIHAEWVKNGRQDNLQERQNYATKYVNAIRVWSNHTMFSGLSQNRSEDERRKIVDEFYKRFQDIVSANPDSHILNLPYAYIHIMKLP